MESNSAWRTAWLSPRVSSLNRARVAAEISHKDVDLLIDECMLLSLELDKFFTVNYSSAAALRDRDTYTLSVDGKNGIQPSFNLSLEAQTCGRYNSQTRKWETL